MLDGLDDLDWSAYRGAYGPCIEAPEILRALAAPDAEAAAEGFFAFGSSIWHQGTVYPVTVAVVPFLVELATTAGVHDRAHLLHVLGALGDPDQSDGADLPAVRAAIAVQTEALLPQLQDPDPTVRESAAYAVALCGPHTRTALDQRWAAEPHPHVRASLLMALAHASRTEPHPGPRVEPYPVAGLLRAAAVGEAFPVPVAAALAFSRAGLRLPAEAIVPMAEAFGNEQSWQGPWSDQDPLAEVLALQDRATAGALTAALTAAPKSRRRAADSKARIRAAHALQEPFGRSRSAPVRMMPQLRALLTDSDHEVQAAAAMTTAWAGTAAAAVAGELVRLAYGEVDDRRYSPAQISLATLARLGDPRWRGPLLAAWSAGTDPWAVRLLAEDTLAFDPEVFAGARRRLGEQVADGAVGDAVRYQARLFGAWGPAAAAAVPDLLAALPAAPAAVCLALARIGPSEPAVASGLRWAVDQPQPGHVRWPDAHADRLRAAHALWQVTGDPDALVAAAGEFLAASDGPWHVGELDRIADAGPAAAPLLPLLLPALTGQAARFAPDRDSQMGAARVVWRATGDARAILPTVEAVLRAGDTSLRTATSLAADLAAPATVDPATADPAGAELVPALRVALRKEWGRIDAARALWRHGADPEDLVGPLLKGIADPYAGRRAVTTLVEMGATGAVPGLTRLAAQDERIHESTDDAVWRDDRLRRDLHDALAALTHAAAS